MMVVGMAPKTASITLEVLLLHAPDKPAPTARISDWRLGADMREDRLPDDGQRWLRRRSAVAARPFSPLRRAGEPEVLEKGQGDHDENGVMRLWCRTRPADRFRSEAMEIR